MKKIKAILLIMLISGMLFHMAASLMGCGGGGGGGGSDPITSPTVSPTTSPTTSPTISPTTSPTITPSPSPTSSTEVSGFVEDENGLPIAGSMVSVIEKGNVGAGNFKAYEASTDSDGKFTIADIPYNSFSLQVSMTGRKTIKADGFTKAGTYDALSFTQLSGSGDTTVSMPPPIILSGVKSGSNINLSWTGSSASGFKSYVVMRSDSPKVNVLDNNVGKFTNIATTSMTDKNLTQGTFYYRVFQLMNSQDGALIKVGSNEESIGLNFEECFPSRLSMLMMKTIPKSDGGYQNQAWYVVTTTDISGIIPTGLGVFVSSPLFTQATAAQYAKMGYKKIKNYYYDYPAHSLGEINMPGEWESKYYVPKDDFAADDRIGSHKIRIGNEIVDFGEFTTGVPQSKIYYPQLSRNSDGNLEVSWGMIQDGTVFSGGAGNYGWKYLVKVMEEGVYAGGNDPDYQYENYWSNMCIRDIGFNRICEVAANMPDISGNRVSVPDGIFTTGSTVTISVYAISTKDSYNNASSGVSGYGKSYMYWLYMGGGSYTVP